MGSQPSLEGIATHLLIANAIARLGGPPPALVSTCRCCGGVTIRFQHGDRPGPTLAYPGGVDAAIDDLPNALADLGYIMGSG